MESKAYAAAHDRLVCIDSDGCAFDTMELKHKECFCPATIHAWGLQPISKYVREAWDFGNLYSIYRGRSRFHELVMLFDWLAQRDEVKRCGFVFPDIASFREWDATTDDLTNASLKRLADAGDPVMRRALDWSLECNRRIAEMVQGIPPFPGVRESLERLSAGADIAIVSATAREALEREWADNGLMPYVTRVCGQDDGTKKQCIAKLRPSYQASRVLMIGDALGDLEAAHENRVLFYPIRPGQEVESWQEFQDEALDRFMTDAYTPEYETKCIERFRACLPDTPPWQRRAG